MRDEPDVVELENLMSAGEALVDGGEEGALEASELGRSETGDARAGRIGAEPVAVLLGGVGDCRDDEAVHSQGGNRSMRVGILGESAL